MQHTRSTILSCSGPDSVPSSSISPSMTDLLSEGMDSRLERAASILTGLALYASMTRVLRPVFDICDLLFDGIYDAMALRQSSTGTPKYLPMDKAAMTFPALYWPTRCVSSTVDSPHDTGISIFRKGVSGETGRIFAPSYSTP